MPRSVGGGGFSGGSRGGGGGSSHGYSSGGMRRIHYGTRYSGGSYGRGGHIFGFSNGFVTVIAVLILVLLISSISFVCKIVNGSLFEDKIIYDKDQFEAYALESYYDVFSEVDDLENNIIIVFAVYDGYDGYECISFIGDNVDRNLTWGFDNNFESVVKETVPRYYEKSFAVKFKQVVEHMMSFAPHIDNENNDLEYECSKIYNRSSMTIDEPLINDALILFAEKTGVNIAIVVDEGEDVFGVDRGVDPVAFVIIIVFVVMMIALVIVVVKMQRKSSYDKSHSENNLDLDEKNSNSEKSNE